MKKILLLIGLTLNLLAGTVQENKISDIDMLIQNQTILANSVEQYVKLYAKAPSSINDIKSKNLLTKSFVSNATYNVNLTSKSIKISTIIKNPEVFQKDYFLYNKNKKRFSIQTVIGNTFTSEYMFGFDTISSVVAKTNFIVSPTEPPRTINTFWYNSITRLQYFYDGISWKNLNIKRIWFLRNLAELPTTSTLGESAIILTPTSLTKYLYTGTGWKLVPQNIPFSYNGSFK